MAEIKKLYAEVGVEQRFKVRASSAEETPLSGDTHPLFLPPHHTAHAPTSLPSHSSNLSPPLTPPQDYEAESYKKLSEAIDAQTALPKPVFTSLLSKIYKRQK